MKHAHYLTAKEVAETLHVSIATVYAYVSRGLLRSEATDHKNRERRYLAEDVQKLLDQKNYRNDPGKIAHSAMHWGMPVLESALTNITETDLYYRGKDATQLAVQYSVEEVASLLWTGDIQQGASITALQPSVEPYLKKIKALDPELEPFQKLQIALTLASTDDLAAYDLKKNAVSTGGKILKLMAAIIACIPNTAAPIVHILQQGWNLPDEKYQTLLNAALIVCADHELNTSSFTARVVASAETHLYAVITAGLSALQGFRHGGATMLVDGLLRTVHRPEMARKIVTERLRRGECVPGFGHKLYPGKDPRAELLLQLLAQTFPNSRELHLAQSLIRTVEEIDNKQPNIDFALGTLSHVLQLAEGSALAILALGRTIGWIGHAIEQYEHGQMIRPRARYIGQQ